jgi:hypothetical protein
MKPINHALISNYHEGMKRKQLTPEDFRKLIQSNYCGLSTGSLFK